LSPDRILELEKKHKESDPPMRILNFMDTIGLGDTTVTFTDEDIQGLIKAELMEKTLCEEINAILIFENPNSPSI
jgi:hypothetical protein